MTLVNASNGDRPVSETGSLGRQTAEGDYASWRRGADHEPRPDTATGLPRRRDDITAERVRYRGQEYWHVRDPLALRYFQLRDEEYFVLSQLDGHTPLEVIQQRFHCRFAPRRIELAQLHWFLGMLHRDGLVIADAPQQGQRLLERRQQRQRRRIWQQLTSPLAIRFRGINPEPILAALGPYCSWIFSPLAVALGMLFIGVAFLWTWLHVEVILARLPELPIFFQVDNILWLAVVLSAVKVLHELAHGLACRRFGGRCRELGVMLLVFTPCLYCNVSDAWMIRGKWRRIAVSAAGIYVELLIAACGLFLWWFTSPGLFNTLCLNVAVVCSVGTVFFNANPLLRYDGYFMLADWLEVPNLSEQSTAVVRRWAASRLLGVRVPEPPLATPRHGALLASYALAAFIYRWVLVLVILWLCQLVLASHRLQIVSQLLTLVVIGGMIAEPSRQAAVFWRDPRHRQQLRGGRVGWIVLLTMAVLGLVLLVPLPCHVVAPALLEPTAWRPVYVTVPGRLSEAAPAGQRVRAGQMVAQLENPELLAEIAQLRGQCDVQRLRVENLERLQVHDRRNGVAGAAGQLPTAREALADLQQRLAKRCEDRERLTLRAPRDGLVLPPRQRQRWHSDGQPEFWDGTPLARQNLGSFLQRGTPFCWIGEPAELEAILVVPETHLALLQPGQSVAVRAASWPHEFVGQIVDIAPSIQNELPPEFVARELVAARHQHNQTRPSTVSYQVRVLLAKPEVVPPARTVGRARITVAPRSLGLRLLAALRRTFAV